QPVAAARATDALDQPVPAQLPEQLFQVGQRNLLALGHPGERDRTLAAVHGHVDHGCHGKPPFGGQSHLCFLRYRPSVRKQILPIPDSFSQLKDQLVQSSIRLSCSGSNRSAVALASPHSMPPACKRSMSFWSRSSVAVAWSRREWTAWTMG